MATYTIKDLEMVCGVKAHTIRTWETRYNIVEPQRTATNIRYYLEEDLKHILNVTILNKNGWKISKIAKLTPEEIANEVALLPSIKIEDAEQLDVLTLSAIEMDEFKFNSILEKNISQIGFEKTIFQVIYPLLDKINFLWFTNSIRPVQAAFLRNLIRQIILAETYKIPDTDYSDTSKPSFITFLPREESCELSILLINYLIKIRGFKLIYLGNQVDVKQVEDAYKIFQADYLFTSISESFIKTSIYTYLNKMNKAAGNTPILLAGFQVIAQSIQSSDTLTPFKSINKIIEFLNYIDEPHQA